MCLKKRQTRKITQTYTTADSKSEVDKWWYFLSYLNHVIIMLCCHCGMLYKHVIVGNATSFIPFSNFSCCCWRAIVHIFSLTQKQGESIDGLTQNIIKSWALKQTKITFLTCKVWYRREIYWVYYEAGFN